MSIQRYELNVDQDGYVMSKTINGGWMRSDDVMEALRQAEQQHDLLAKCDRCIATGYKQGQRDALAGAVQRHNHEVNELRHANGLTRNEAYEQGQRDGYDKAKRKYATTIIHGALAKKPGLADAHDIAEEDFR